MSSSTCCFLTCILVSQESGQVIWHFHLFKTFPQFVIIQGSLVAQVVKHLPTMRETWAQSLVREDPLEKEMATHSSIHAWEIPWTEDYGELQPMGSKRIGHD